MGVASVLADVAVSGEAGASKLEHQQRPHKIRNNAVGEGYGQPEKRTSEHIKTVRANKIDTQICVPIPEYITAFDRLVSQTVKRYLLYVKVTVIEEIASVSDDIYSKKYP